MAGIRAMRHALSHEGKRDGNGVGKILTEAQDRRG